MSGRVLVTGATGFVGAHLLAELGERAVPAHIDVTAPDEVAAAVVEARPDAVVHLAALSSVAESWRHGAEVWRVNAIGTVNVLDAVRAERPEARTLVVSTGEVYGDTGERPAPEDREPAPLSPYAASKVAAEVAAARAARAEGLDVVVARPFPHTGPGQGERFAVGSWTHQISRMEVEVGGALRVGDLSVRRDLTDFRDVWRAYRLLLEPGVRAGVYNVASGTAVALSRVVELLAGMASCPISVERDPARLRPVDVRVLCGDPSRLAAATGWKPDISLERALADALDEARRAVRQERMAPL